MPSRRAASSTLSNRVGTTCSPLFSSTRTTRAFCLVSGNMDIDAMTQAFLDALPKIERVAGEDPVGFWHVYRDGKIKRIWP